MDRQRVSPQIHFDSPADKGPTVVRRLYHTAPPCRGRGLIPPTQGAIEVVENHFSWGFYSRIFLMPKKEPQIASHNRPKRSKRPSGLQQVQDADNQKNDPDPEGRSLGHKHRSHRRLPAYFNSRQKQEVPKVCLPRDGIPVHCPSIRTIISPLRLYPNGYTTGKLRPEIGHSSPPIPGRLVDTLPKLSDYLTSHGDSLYLGASTGLEDQPQEVGTDPKADFCFIGVHYNYTWI